jgi:hypothetical protein
MGNPDEDGLKTAKEKSKQKFEDLSESAREGFQNMESKASMCNVFIVLFCPLAFKVVIILYN